MSPGDIIWIVYGVGALFTGFYAGFTRMSWDTPAPVGAVAFWPLVLPILLGAGLRNTVERRAKRLKEREAEHRKWLNAKVD